MQTSESFDVLPEKLLEIQQQIEPPGKDRKVSTDYFTYSYTTLDHLLEEVKPILNSHNIVLLQPLKTFEGEPHVETTLLHKSGEWVRDCTQIMRGPEQKVTSGDSGEYVVDCNDPQDYGQGITYSRRYSLSSLLGISTATDHDGQTISDNSSSYGGSKKMADNEGSVTDNQLSAIHGIANSDDVASDEKGLSSKEEFTAYIKKSSDVTSLKKLSKKRASNIIDWLKGLQGGG